MLQIKTTISGIRLLKCKSSVIKHNRWGVPMLLVRQPNDPYVVLSQVKLHLEMIWIDQGLFDIGEYLILFPTSWLLWSNQ